MDYNLQYRPFLSQDVNCWVLAHFRVLLKKWQCYNQSHGERHGLISKSIDDFFQKELHRILLYNYSDSILQSMNHLIFFCIL